ncbi:MAG TPA: hypothetical protein VEK07_07040 [Polyangiaceae bacterium]|nr:hypothetical protein [Polyangiaceae bacterium]
MTYLSQFVVFKNACLAERYATRTMPMATLLEAYLDGDVEIPDIDAFLDVRQDVVAFTLTADHVRFLVTRMLPEWAHTLPESGRAHRARPLRPRKRLLRGIPR